MFEFDEVKSLSNKEKHGIDFHEARELWNDPERIVVTAKTVDEKRFLLVAKYQTVVWSAVYTLRNGNVRIISVRKARENEKEIYKCF